MTTLNSQSCIDCALDLWALNFSIIPIPYREKACRILWKRYQRERASLDQVLKWFIDRELNIGVVTGAVSGIAVVDTDSPASEDWAKTHLPDTPWIVKTAKGRHRYYRHPGGLVRNRAGVLTADGRFKLDIRADGGYALGRGSIHPSGCRYLAEGDWSAPLNEVPVFDESWLSPKCTVPARSESSTCRSFENSTSSAPPAPLPESELGELTDRVRRLLAGMPPAIQGQGGDAHTFHLACILMKGYGLPFQVALDLFREWNERCIPPWDERDLRKKLDNANKYGKGTVGAMRPRYLTLFIR